MKSGSAGKIDLFILYISYFLFLFSALLITRNSSAISYVTNFVAIMLTGSYLLVHIKQVSRKIKLSQVLGVFLIVPVLILIIAIRIDIYSFLLFTKILVFGLFFTIATFDANEFCDFLNRTYAVYAFISVLFFFNLMPFSLYEKWDHPTMYVDVGLFNYYIFYGLEGGASSMDSYSGLILVCNIFLNKRENRKYFIALSIFFVLYTLKMTPIMGLLLSLSGYFFIRGPKTAIISILIGNAFFICTIYWLINRIDPFGSSIPFWEVMYGATHARSMIWEQQVQIMLKEYNPINYILGGFNIELFSIPALQIWGQETGDFYDNPHNTYLMMLFRVPMLFIICYLSLLVLIYKKFNRKEFVVMLFIMIVSYTNSIIISIQNPVYLFAILYLLLTNNEFKYHENTLPAPGS